VVLVEHQAIERDGARMTHANAVVADGHTVQVLADAACVPA
jgi:hypothetical protein